MTVVAAKADKPYLYPSSLPIYRTEQYIPRPFAPGPHPLAPASRRRPRPSLRRLSSHLLYIILYIYYFQLSLRPIPGGSPAPASRRRHSLAPLRPAPAKPPPPPPSGYHMSSINR